ncbi:UDP-N-acetylmuramoyl-L-alanyl-D-glutamate--2,6-diaminopimelate ligase [Deinobacterium chartae]|uniref:UDP-N-acetylmuramyl-tripeptide synthetase n=1 Tax=Deinobacterium chartae TaxID=521158 RepID=A0A841HXD3_9DEIO|nr:UDP-N-acetylmuramoyl-L-alanyl-D-glutamate--2,6-diaminopimelate ligase [Deinobacterium chartae]MBB6096622.1 UDP-N-acetylmuramoyl-L-alanyl-D-glutamate--2,6-diaminopimelate ligase [Deinobacterium chartae]
MKLSDLLHAAGYAPPADLPGDLEVRGVTHNAAWAEPGFAFVAIRGARFDGHAFLDQARARGAVLAVGEGSAHSPLPYLRVPDPRAALADLAAALEGHPSRALRVVGVTGTDGKTTTSWLTHHLLRTAGLAPGLLSTAGYRLPGGALQHFPAHFTTPEAPQVQRVLRDILEAGGRSAVLEASSHALALERVRAVDWDVAVWTHLSREHLDFHGDLEGYFAAKARLVERAPFAVLNADDPWTARLKHRPHTTYAEQAPADWRASAVHEGPDGLRFRVDSPAGVLEAHLPMTGRFNVQNALAAMAAAWHLGASADQLLSGLSSFPGVPGRMQLIPGPANDTRVIVDFAHTPPALEKALLALRPTTPGRLIVVIGSAGGNRDPGKRAPLGETATRLADLAIFTEEDCRDTPIEQILGEMARGAREAGRDNFVLEADRERAIRRAILEEARPGDTVLLAGKGPEETLERAHETLPWDEAALATAVLRERQP